MLRKALVFLPILLMAAEWDRFRGPNGSGIREETNPPLRFGPKENLAWRTAVPFGRSSPVLGGGAVFLTASGNALLVTLALDAATGGIRWRRELKPRHTHRIYQSNDAASPSPATDGQHVYAFFADFGLISYTADGAERWRLPLGPFENFYGMGASPVIAGSTLLLSADQRKDSYLLAVDKDTGRIRWKADRGHLELEGYSTPIVHQGQVIVHSSFRVEAYSLSTGKLVWHARRQGYNAKGTPVIYRDLLIASASGSDQPVYPTFQALDANGDGRITPAEFDRNDDLRGHFPTVDTNHDGYATPAEWNFIRGLGVGDYGMCGIRLGGAGDVTDSHIVWRNKKTYPNVPAPLVYKDVLYAIRNGGIVTSYDPMTGTAIKSVRVRDGLGDYYASPVAAAGRIYLAGESGKVAVVKAGPELDTLAVNDLGEEIYATPALDHERIYIRTTQALYAFGGRTSK
ncbi:MAG: PQQ-binding-like beta-propeller repeat protein [Bryobacteraceae bacterium]|nr:PQQ-binding-like beta-propeller repeat protein [Bryobacteraceae bacterium]